MEKSELPKIILVSFAIVFALFLGSFFLFTAGFEPTYVVEEPLPKNAAFALLPGDSLSYNLTYLNESAEVTFLFGKTPSSNCTLVAVAGENLTTCVSQDGRDGEDNHSLAPGFFFSSPWMLALSANFSWASVLMNTISREPVQSFHARVIGKEIHRGRSAYLVEAQEAGALGDYARKIWIDEKSRIILKEEGENYTIVLTRAHFPLK